LFTGNESRLLGLGATGEGLELFGSDRQADTAFFNEVNQGDLFGRGGSDILGAFESQEASLFGGAGNDILASYQSHSTLSGGSGNDVFLAFNPGQDDHTTVRSGPGQNAIVSLTGRTTIEDSEASREAQNLLLHYSGQTDIARLNAQDAVEVAPVPLDALVQNGFISQGMAQEIPSELAAWSNATLTLDGGTAAIDFGEGNVVSIGSYHSNSINGIIQRVNEQGGSVVVNSAPEPFDGGQVNTPGEEGNGGEEDNQSDLPGIFGP
jgi:hypothetical protein